MNFLKNNKKITFELTIKKFLKISLLIFAHIFVFPAFFFWIFYAGMRYERYKNSDIMDEPIEKTDNGKHQDKYTGEIEI